MTSPDGTRQVYAQWAEKYDRDPNPVTALARRMLEPLLSDVRDKVVLDIGCGTGQELELAVAHGAKAVGIDFTPEMLRVAAKKRSIGNLLVQADACMLPLQEGSADVVICSFVLSFVSKLAEFAEQLAAIAIPGADVYLADMHPEAQRLGWRCALSPDGQVPPTIIHELTRIRQAFDAAGFELEMLHEPRLGHPERRLFETVVRPDLYDQARRVPAMYVFHFRRRLLSTDRIRHTVVRRNRPHAVHLLGVRVALGPHTAVQSDVVLEGERIKAIYDRPSRARAARAEGDEIVDLSGMMLLPGLINAHDHLLAGWPPSISHGTQLWLGALRNLLGGATTVLHHGIRDIDGLGDEFPIRLIRQYGWSPAKMKVGLARAFSGAPVDVPFVIDCDLREPSEKKIEELLGAGVLSPRTILVGTGYLGPSAQNLLEQTGTSIVWSPAAEMAMLGRTLDPAFVVTSHLIALGTGHTSDRSLREEVRAAVSIGMRPEAIYSMVTSRPFSMLRLRNGEGRIVANTPADLTLFPDEGQTPAQALCAHPEEFPLGVLVGGRAMVTSDSVNAQLPESWKKDSKPAAIDGQGWRLHKDLYDAVSSALRAVKSEFKICGKTVSL